MVDKVVRYSEIENLNFIDALKLNSILDYRHKLELLARESESNEKE